MPFLVYLSAINLISVIVCWSDKRSARWGGRRVSEKSLFTIVFLGGGMGMYLSMKTLRHKTLHKRFMIGIPLIILLQIAIALLMNYYY